MLSVLPCCCVGVHDNICGSHAFQDYNSIGGAVPPPGNSKQVIFVSHVTSEQLEVRQLTCNLPSCLGCLVSPKLDKSGDKGWETFCVDIFSWQ